VEDMILYTFPSRKRRVQNVVVRVT